jgi:hypothetical protein
VDTSSISEGIAYQLLLDIAKVEKKFTYAAIANADRKWILDTYVECLDAVTGKRVKAGSKSGRTRRST